VQKNVRQAIVRNDETVPLGNVEPLDRSGNFEDLKPACGLGAGWFSPRLWRELVVTHKLTPLTMDLHGFTLASWAAGRASAVDLALSTRPIRILQQREPIVIARKLSKRFSAFRTVVSSANSQQS
jgi:hypothetical protein